MFTLPPRAARPNRLNCERLSPSGSGDTCPFLFRIGLIMRFRILAAAALGAVTAMTALTATPALADAPRTFATAVSGTCDTATGEWVVDWAITNQSDTAALLILVDSTPAESRLTSLPWPQAGATEHAVQRIPGDSADAHLDYIAVWTDFPGGSFRSTADFTPATTCEQAELAG